MRKKRVTNAAMRSYERPQQRVGGASSGIRGSASLVIHFPFKITLPFVPSAASHARSIRRHVDHGKAACCRNAMGGRVGDDWGADFIALEIVYIY
jgi:hypothetical protein